MTAVFVPYVQGVEACQYLAGNGAELVAQLAGSSFTSDTGGVLTFTDQGSNVQVYNSGAILYRGADEVFAGSGDPGAQFFKLIEVIQANAASGVQLVTRRGSAAIPASVLGNAGANYDITLDGAMPSATYYPTTERHGAPTIISGHSVLSVTPLSATQVRVVVQSAAASLAGCTIRVQAQALAATS